MSVIREMIEEEFHEIVGKVFEKKVQKISDDVGKHFSRFIKTIVLLDFEMLHIEEHLKEEDNKELSDWVESARMWIASFPAIPESIVYRMNKFETKEKTKRR